MNASPDTVRDAVLRAQGALERAGIDRPHVEARLLVGAALGLGRAELALEGARRLDALERGRIEAMLERRVQREPLQHILGSAAFYGLELAVDSRVLVPRPETERLVEIALERIAAAPDPRVLDVGTGSGAIALALKAERPDAVVAASDVSLDALAVARENAAALALEVRFFASDLLDDPSVLAFARSAQLVVSNPPYLPEGDRDDASPEVRRDPASALYAGTDGLRIARRLVEQAGPALAPGARLLLELDPRNVRTLEREGLERGWAGARVHRDLADRERFLELER